MKDRWVEEYLLGSGARMPFSFVYGGLASDAFLASLPRTTERTTLDQGKIWHSFVWSDPETGLEVRCVAVEYTDYPALEWTVYFTNRGTANTPILERIHGLDAAFRRDPGDEFVLHGTRGDWCAAESYEPFRRTLDADTGARFAPFGGRPTNAAFPYFNVQMPGGGVFLAVGWPGQWACSFHRDADRGLRVTAGQEQTHLSLRPGEHIRSPLIALLFWQGTDLVDAHNRWRRWMLAHNLPRTAGGALPPPQIVACSSHQFKEMTEATEENQKGFVDRYIEEGMALDYWWMDAGWYPCAGAWVKTGTWEPDTTRFPEGLRAVSDHAHARGVKIITWFEPERVGDPDSWIARNHPEWLLSRRGKTPDGPPGGHFGGGPGRLLNLGDPEARSWCINHVDRMLTEQGIDVYRQDFNMDPLAFWVGNDTAERQGMTENLHVQGYLAYWDELRRRHPGLLIDSCASGGRRNDLETLRRAVPLIRSDHLFEPISQQCHHLSFAAWVPYHGAGYLIGASAIGQQGPPDVDAYGFRSNMSASLTLCYDMRREDLNYELARSLFRQLRQIAPNYLGDFYPLTAYSLDSDAWLAWQYDRPASGEGMVQAFRRPHCAEARKTFRLGGLEPAAHYDIADVDLAGATRLSGSALMEEGLSVAIPARPGAALITYRRVAR